MISGAADNTLRLWDVATGKCLYTWEFPTAVKRVAFNDDGTQAVCITEQRMGYQGAIRVFKLNREGDVSQRMNALIQFLITFLTQPHIPQSRKNPNTSSTLSDQKRQSARSLTPQVLLSLAMSRERLRYSSSKQAMRFTITKEPTVIP